MKSHCIYGNDDCTLCKNSNLPRSYKKNLPTFNIMKDDKSLEQVLDGLNAEKLKIWDRLPTVTNIAIRQPMLNRLREIDNFIKEIFNK